MRASRSLEVEETIQDGERGVYALCKVLHPEFTRRRFLRSVSLAAGFFTLPGAFAEELMRKTPWGTQGPLYRIVAPKSPLVPLDT